MIRSCELKTFSNESIFLILYFSKSSSKTNGSNPETLISFSLRNFIRVNAIESLTSLVPGTPLKAIPKIHAFLNLFFLITVLIILQQYSSFNFLADNIIEALSKSFTKMYESFDKHGPATGPDFGILDLGYL